MVVNADSLYYPAGRQCRQRNIDRSQPYIAIALQGQEHYRLEFDPRGGQLRPSKEVLDWTLTLCSRHCHLFRWPVCPVRYTATLIS